MIMRKWPTLYSKTATGNINFWLIWTDGATVGMQWGKLGTDKPLEDSYTAIGKNIGRSNETSAEIQAELEADAKFIKQKRLKYVESVEAAQSGFNLKPMRAYAIDEKRKKKISYPVTVQPKYNGCRCMAYKLPDGSIRLMTRGGKDYIIPHIQAELMGKLEDGWCLDGEIYAHGYTLQKIRNLILTYSPASLVLKFVCYDMTRLPPDKTPWNERQVNLSQWFKDYVNDLEKVIMSSSWISGSWQSVDELHDDLVKSGFEGCILRLRDGVYRCAAKSTELLKHKKFKDAEFRIVGWTVGRDGVLVYTCVQEQGIEFEVRPIGDEAERAELLKTADADIGKLLTVKFQERSDDNVPLIVSGIAIRGEEDLD